MADIIKLKSCQRKYAECSQCGYTQYHLLLPADGSLIVEAYQCVECGAVIEIEPDNQVVFSDS